MKYRIITDLAHEMDTRTFDSLEEATDYGRINLPSNRSWEVRDEYDDVVYTHYVGDEATVESKLWYAVMRDRDDIDWGTGSYNLDEARELMNDWRNDGWEDAYIAVIDESGELGAVCVDEYHD